jgi:hypothetical protein
VSKNAGFGLIQSASATLITNIKEFIRFAGTNKNNFLFAVLNFHPK